MLSISSQQSITSPTRRVCVATQSLYSSTLTRGICQVTMATLITDSTKDLTQMNSAIQWTNPKMGSTKSPSSLLTLKSLEDSRQACSNSTVTSNIITSNNIQRPQEVLQPLIIIKTTSSNSYHHQQEVQCCLKRTIGRPILKFSATASKTSRKTHLILS